MLSPSGTHSIAPLLRWDAMAEADNHFVLFYEELGSLASSVGKYIADGLAAGEPVIVVAMPDHTQRFWEALASEGIDVQGAIAAGRLTSLDARKTLEAITRAGVPDAAAFRDVVGGAFTRATADRPGARVRAYGEMVDILCAAGQPESALVLEQLWNDLAREHSFSLFCAYVKDRFAGPGGPDVRARVCATHAHAFEARSGARSHVQQRIRLNGVVDAFRLMIESVQDYAIFMLDPGGMIVTWNLGAERMKGYRGDEIIGRHFSIFLPGDVAAIQCAKELEIAARDGRFEDEGWRVRKDGTRFWANVIITRLCDETGTIVGFAKVTQDLTERKRAEADRERLLRSQEANRSRDELLAVVSHELRGPLNSILGWGQHLESSTSDPMVAKAAATIVRNAYAQARLIEDLLDVSRIVAGKMSLDLGPCDLAAVVRNAVDGIRLAASAKSISIAFDTESATVFLVCDGPRMTQVVSNLLSNAVKFTPAGGSIVVSLVRDGDTLRMSVRDTGRGIAPSFLPHVFERFRQEEAGQSARASGLGLGLAIVRHLVELHGGSVVAESAGEGAGAAFHVTLPSSAARDVELAAALETDVSGFPLAGLTVLVVDDDPDAREMLAALMTAHGARVMVAASAREARGRLDARTPDVVISDVGMPEEDGCDLMRSVRLRAGDGRDVRAIALTAFASSKDRERALEAGFDAHVPKPLHVKDLVSLVRDLAAGRR